MVRKVVTNISTAIGRTASFLMKRKLFGIFKLIKDAVYSGWVKPFLKKGGNNFSLQYPMNHTGLEFITIGNDFICFARLRLEAFDEHLNNRYTPAVEIGDNVSINFDCHIACVNKIIIGNNVLIASKVFITDHSHGEVNAAALETAPWARKVISKGPVIIEDNVWIGEGVAILPNVTIGKNSIIGANAVVTKSFPENSLIGGNPAKLIRTIE